MLDLRSGETRRVTDSPAVDANPTWSPGGDAIAFNSSRSGRGDLYTISLETGVRTQLTREPATEQGPSWSKDGQIAYFSTQSGAPEIFTLDVSSGEVEQLTCGTNVCSTAR